MKDATLEAESAPGDGGVENAPRRRGRALLAVGAAGVTLLVAAGAVWVLRVPIAAAMVRSALADQGVESDFRLSNLGFDGATLRELRLGAAASPTLTAAHAEIDIAWRGFTPTITGVRLDSPRLHARLDDQGLSLGQLDALLKPGPPSGRRPTLDGLRLDIEDGQALLDTPFGRLPVNIESAGTFGRDLRAAARLAPTRAASGEASLTNARAQMTLASDPAGLRAQLTADADAIAHGALSGEGLSVRFELTAPNDLARVALDGVVRLREGALGETELAGLALGLEAAAALQATALAPEDWRAAANATLVRMRGPAVSLQEASLFAEMAGDAQRGAGRLTVETDQPAVLAGFAGAFAANAELHLEFEEDAAFTANARLQGRDLALTQGGRAAFRRAWPQLGGAPVGPLFADAGAAIERALTDAALDVPLQFTYEDGSAQLVFAGPASLDAANGARARLTPLSPDAPLFLYEVGGAIGGAAELSIAGGGLPQLTASLSRISGAAGRPIEIDGVIAAPDWRAEDAALSAPRLETTLRLDGAAGSLRVAGPVTMSGPAGGLIVRDMILPADIEAAWGDGVRVAPAGGACMPVRFAGVAAPGVEMAAGEARLCPREGVFYAANARGAVSGGFTIEGLSLPGALAGEAREPVLIAASSVNGQFSGAADRLVLDIAADAPAFAIDLAPERRLRIEGERLTARAEFAAGAWRAAGRLDGAGLDDPALPARLTALAFDWTAASAGESGVLLVVENGAARLSERRPPNPDANYRTPFHPIALQHITARLQDGRLAAAGALLLESGGISLGAFTAVHDLETAEGRADVEIPELRFTREFQPAQLSDLARGFAENVSGPISAAFQMRWAPGDVAATGRVALNDVSLASSTLPIIDNVVGAIVFDDLFSLSTPPGQRLTVGRLNPGIAVENGVVQFQLLSEGRVAIEDARWPFAQGQLSVEPTTLTLGSPETRFRLVLRDVDVAALLDTLRIPDLTATGQVEGEFPLLLTPTAALIENGALRSAPPGGEIAYSGAAGENAEGMARIAFDALTSFRYQSLTLTLNGDLGGDVVTHINFSGINQRRVELSEMTGGVPVIGPRGIPFRFNVGVTAPFRRLAGAANAVTNPVSVIDFSPSPAAEPDAAPELEGEGQPPAAEPAPAPVDPPP